MIKTKDGKTTASGTKADLLMDFTGTAEMLMRRTPITAEELIKAVKTAKMVAKIKDLIDGIDEESITAISEEDKPEAEDEWVEAEKKATAKKGAVKEIVLEDDDLDEMLEWLKGELEELKERFDD